MRNLLATLAIAGMSTVSFAQANVEATKTADANFFEGSSASIWNLMSIDSNNQTASFSVQPHLTVAVGGLFNVNFNVDVPVYDAGAESPTKIEEVKGLFDDLTPKIYASKSFEFLGGKLLLNPALESELPTNGLAVTIEPHLEVVAPLAKISTKSGTVSPYFYGYYETQFAASKVEADVDQIKNDFESDQERVSLSLIHI